MTTIDKPDQPPLSQPVLAPLTRAAIFLVVTVKPDRESYSAVRSFCGDVAGLIRAVEFRDIDAGLTCIVGFGSDAWDQLFGSPRPAELHPFREIPERQPPCCRHSRRRVVSHPRRTNGYLFRAGNTDYGAHRQRS